MSNNILISIITHVFSEQNFYDIKYIIDDYHKYVCDNLDILSKSKII